MVYSMTGFGRAEYQDEEKKITVEMKSVNHRYLDFNFKMPKKFMILDPFIRSVLKDYIKRGKTDVFITYENYSEKSSSLKYNEDIAAQYLKYAEQMKDKFGLPNDISVSRLLRFPDVITSEDSRTDEEELKREIESVLRECAVRFQKAREIEGMNLQKDLLSKLDAMELCVGKIQEREPQIMEEYSNRLRAKTAELLSESGLDEGRIAAEVVIYADKICKDEETVRLLSHIRSMKKELTSGGAVGRKLDFIAQEMNREANTILSKSNDLGTSDLGIELKTEIEKIREQIQNIE